MPLISRWKRIGLVWQLGVVAIFFILVSASLAFALVANGHATSTAQEGKDLAQCVNTALGQRNDPGLLDARAHIAFAQEQAKLAQADKAFTVALNAVLVASKVQQAARYAEFLAASKAKQDEAVRNAAAAITYAQTLQADQAIRDQHPLGKC